MKLDTFLFKTKKYAINWSDLTKKNFSKKVKA